MGTDLSLFPVSNSLSGGNSKWEPPDPISNSEVKLLSADGSTGSPRVRVGHCQAFKYQKAPLVGAFFLIEDLKFITIGDILLFPGDNIMKTFPVILLINLMIFSTVTFSQPNRDTKPDSILIDVCSDGRIVELNGDVPTNGTGIPEIFVNDANVASDDKVGAAKGGNPILNLINGALRPDC